MILRLEAESRALPIQNNRFAGLPGILKIDTAGQAKTKITVSLEIHG